MGHVRVDAIAGSSHTFGTCSPFSESHSTPLDSHWLHALKLDFPQSRISAPEIILSRLLRPSTDLTIETKTVSYLANVSLYALSLFNLSGRMHWDWSEPL